MIFLCLTSEFRSEASRDTEDLCHSSGGQRKLEQPKHNRCCSAYIKHSPRGQKGNVFLPKTVSSLPKDSVALVHQIITVDKFRLEEKISTLPKNALSEIDKAIDYVLKN